jgi:hypothetical protein
MFFQKGWVQLISERFLKLENTQKCFLFCRVTSKKGRLKGKSPKPMQNIFMTLDIMQI